jgi:hypothetical protein
MYFANVLKYTGGNMIWIVEIKEWTGWQPCSSAYMTRAEARNDIVDVWKRINPSMKFRVRKYAPVFKRCSGSAWDELAKERVSQVSIVRLKGTADEPLARPEVPAHIQYSRV